MLSSSPGGVADRQVRPNGSAVPILAAKPASWRIVVVAWGESCGSSMSQCAPLVTRAKSIGATARLTSTDRTSAAETSTSVVPITIAGLCRSSRHSPSVSQRAPIATCSVTSSVSPRFASHPRTWPESWSVSDRCGSA